ncbi:MAG TPA: hypothetical protein EYP53_05315 [Candidatus Latescibacteria bacterium]|nr:hypothetical protein [Candidatus Latescibacterota bacterium]
MEDHFDVDPELVKALTDTENSKLLAELDYEKTDVTFFYVRQGSPLGLGDAIGCAKDFVGDEPFIVALGDTIIRSVDHPDLVARLVASHVRHGSDCTLAVCEVDEDEVSRYGIVKPKGNPGDEFEIDGLVEKPPKEEAPSRYAIAARYVFSPTIFEAIQRTVPEVGGEVEITDAIGVLLKMGGKVRCIKLTPGERRYDIGNHESYFKAFVDFALDDEKYGYIIRQYLMRRLKGM